MFNALKYTEELEKAGFSREQAETSVKLLIEVMNENFATKSDLTEAAHKIETRIKDLESTTKELDGRMGSQFKEVTSAIQSLEHKHDSSARELEYKLTIKLGAFLTLAVGTTAAIVKILAAG
jgi:chaperonin cofactor prefoldin